MKPEFKNVVTPIYLKEMTFDKPIKDLTVQIITHDDMDGYASAAVVVNALIPLGVKKDSIVIIHANYSNTIPHIYSDVDLVFITDYSISNLAFADALLEAHSTGHKIIWIDHHQTSLDIPKKNAKYKPLEKILGVRNNQYCATMLAYLCLNPGIKSIPRVVELVDDFDCWKKKIKESDYLNYAFNNNLAFEKDPKSAMWAYLITNNAHAADSLLEHQLQYGKTFAEVMTDADYTQMTQYGFIAELDKFPGIEILCLNSTSKGSTGLSSYFKSKTTPDGRYPYGCVFGFNGEQFEFSIYTDGAVSPNAQHICEKYGGGGHPDASGFQIKHNPLKVISRKLKG